MNFEWDAEKSQRTLGERGIDFASIVKVWNDDDAIEITARSDTEPRWAKIGKFEELIYVGDFYQTGFWNQNYKRQTSQTQ